MSDILVRLGDAEEVIVILPAEETNISLDLGTGTVGSENEEIKVELSSQGADGREVELSSSETHLIWRYIGATIWTNLIPLSEIKGNPGNNGADGEDGVPGNPGENGSDGADGANGTDGREVEIGASATHIQWRYVGELAWTNLVALSSLQGPPGPQGESGANGLNPEFRIESNYIQWRYVDGGMEWANLVDLTTLVGPQGPQGDPGANGADGNTVLYGSGAPSSEVGNSGNFYIDSTGWNIYGPKASETWPEGQSLIGIQGPQGEPGADGANGADGKTVRYGIGAPGGGLGVDGDFYIATSTHFIYGPKTGGVWPAGVSLIGPQGDPGADGADGADGTNGTNGINGTNGADGKTVRYSTGAPGGGVGVDGDFYISTDTHFIYGPKASGTWPTGTSLVGPQGATGPAGVSTDVIGITIDGGGSTITTGTKGFISIPYACTINSVTLLADQTGSVVVDIWKDTYANYPPTVADTITASAKPTLSSASKSTDSTLTGWTTSVNAGDVIGFNVDSAATITRLALTLKVTK